MRKYLFLIVLTVLSSGILRAQNTIPTKTSMGIHNGDSLFQICDWKGARASYKSADQNDFKIIQWSRLGFSDYHLGKYEEAIEAYEKIINGGASPARGLTFSRIAKIYALENDTQDAITALDSAVANGYANYSEMDTLRDFVNIVNDPEFLKCKQKVFAAAFPCMSDPHAREFDFWVGEWDVYITGTKTLAGHSLIQMISGGCAVLENWDSPASNGKSINYVDPVSKKWKQNWAGSYPNGIQEFANGEYRDGAMRFTYETVNAQNQKIIGRFIFYNEKPGQVRQFNETSADEGKTWVTSYDYTYIRKA